MFFINKNPLKKTNKTKITQLCTKKYPFILTFYLCCYTIFWIYVHIFDLFIKIITLTTPEARRSKMDTYCRQCPKQVSKKTNIEDKRLLLIYFFMQVSSSLYINKLILPTPNKLWLDKCDCLIKVPRFYLKYCWLQLWCHKVGLLHFHEQGTICKLSVLHEVFN